MLVDRDEARARALARRFRVPRTAAALDEVLDEIDGAVLAVPPHLHHPLALQCVRRGVHVLCEKPLADTAEKAAEIVEEARRAGVRVAVNNTRRLFPACRKVKELLDAGAIGTPRRLSFVHGEVFDWPIATDSYFGVKGGGRGVLLDVGAHALDQALWWLGGEPALRDYRDDSFGGTEASAAVRFESAGCEVEIRLSWLSKLENVYRIRGDRGVLEAGVYDTHALHRTDASGRRRKLRCPGRPGVYAELAEPLVANFLDVLAGGAEPLVSAAAVLPSIALLDACYARRERFDMPWHDAWQRLRDA